jgi:hypothetical protein
MQVVTVTTYGSSDSYSKEITIWRHCPPKVYVSNAMSKRSGCPQADGF